MTSGPTRKRVVFAEEGQRHASPIPEAVIANGFVFLSAVRGVNPESQQVELDDPEAQSRQLFENIKSTLRAVGGTLDDIVKIAVFMKDLGDRDAFNKVWKEYFGEEPPARFAAQVVDIGVLGDKTKFLADVTALAPDG